MTGQPNNPFIEHDAEREARPGGDAYTFTFGNGYGASVIRNQYSYGGKSGAWEVGVLDGLGNPTYATPITRDVLGWQSVDDVREVLRKIAELPAVQS